VSAWMQDLTCGRCGHAKEDHTDAGCFVLMASFVTPDEHDYCQCKRPRGEAS
jgi:hypothetical protein